MKHVFMARQPIFNTNQETIGYEILFRNGEENFFDSLDPDNASYAVINNTFNIFGLNNVTNGKKAFINFTQNLLMKGDIELLPKEGIIIEILETVEPSDEIFEICKKFKNKGYKLALDDFIFHPKWSAFFEIVDIIKIDFMEVTGNDREEVIKKVGNRDIEFLAERVETYEEFEYAKKVGYKYFQGFFFSKPHMITAKIIPENKLNCMQLLSEATKENVDFDIIQLYIKRDISLTYKLLRFINSPALGLTNKIDSIKQAIVYMGEKELRKWVALVSMTVMSTGKTNELLNSTMVRALFGEGLARYLKTEISPENYFLMGILSLIDAFLDKPKNDILKELNLTHLITDSIINHDGPMYDIYKLMLTYERSEWEEVVKGLVKLKVPVRDISEIYLNSVNMADSLVQTQL